MTSRFLSTEVARGISSIVLASMGIAAVAVSAYFTWSFLTGASSIGKLSSVLAKCVPSLAGAAAGAGLAYAVQETREKRKERRENATAAGLAIVKLGQIYSAYVQYQAQVMSRGKDHEFPWYAIPAGDLYAPSWQPIDMASLQFLLRSAEPEIVSLVALEELRFLNAIEIIKRRSTMLHVELQGRLEAAGLDGAVNVQRFLNVVGPRIRGSLEDYTRFILTVIPENELSSMKIATDLRRIALTMVGDEGVVGIEPGVFEKPANELPLG